VTTFDPMRYFVVHLVIGDAQLVIFSANPKGAENERKNV
jgi:hypothetical protein